MIPRWLQQAASPGIVFFAFALWLLQGGLLFRYGPYPRLRATVDGTPLPEETFTYSGPQLAGFFDELGEEGRAAYVRFQQFDYFNAFFLTAALVLVWVFCLTRLTSPGSPLRAAAYLPILVGVLDFLENGLLWQLAASYPDLSPLLVQVTSLLTAGKLALAFLLLPLTLLGLLATTIVRFRHRRSVPPGTNPSLPREGRQKS